MFAVEPPSKAGLEQGWAKDGCSDRAKSGGCFGDGRSRTVTHRPGPTVRHRGRGWNTLIDKFREGR